MRRLLPIALLVLGCSALSVTAHAQRRRALPQTRMDVSVHQADVRNVLRLFAEVGHVNIVYGDDVTGTVTFRFHRVPWADALRAVLRTKGLDMEWDGRILRVATFETFQREREARLAEVRTCEQTAPLRTRILRLSYARAAEMAPLVRSRLTERGSVEVDERTNSLVVRDVDCPR